MKFKYLLFLSLCFGVSAVYAQSTFNRGKLPFRLYQYEDSLNVFRQKLDSLLSASSLSYAAKRHLLRERLGDARPGLEYNSIFLPPTFYKSVSHNNFSLDETPTLLDKTLLDLYLNRPDLVMGTETQLDKIGGTVDAAPIHVDHAPEIVSQVAPKAIEPGVAPVDVVILKPDFWTFTGDYYLQFLQNYVSSNWYKGGESNYSMVGAITLNADYNNKQKVKWGNRLEMKLGFQTSREDTKHSFRTSENLLRLTSKLGLQASKKWYYTAQIMGYTQFARQWKSNSDELTTEFLGPFVMNLSFGMDYDVSWLKKRLTGTIHLAPLAYNFKYVKRSILASRYGIEKDKHQLHDFGSQLTVDLNWKFSDNISWKTRLYGYTTYHRAELEWENTFTFQFNKWISTKLFVYPRFDDGLIRVDRHGYWQLKEYMSIGFSYSF